MNRRCKIYKESVSFSLIFKPVRSTRNIFGWKQPGPLPQGTPRSGVGSQGPVLLTLVASDSSRKPAFATLSVLLTCRDAIARCDVAGNCCVSSPAGAGVCRSRKHGSCEPIDMLFHLQKLSQRHRDFRLWRVHVEDMTVEEPLGNFPVNWSAAHGLRRRYLAFPAVEVVTATAVINCWQEIDNQKKGAFWIKSPMMGISISRRGAPILAWLGLLTKRTRHARIPPMTAGVAIVVNVGLYHSTATDIRNCRYEYPNGGGAAA